MKFVVIGKARAGKSTFGAALGLALQTEATDTSAALVTIEQRRQELLGSLAPAAGYDSTRNRPSRPYLVALGDAIKVLDESLLAGLCFRRGDICVGVRRQTELDAVRKAFPEAKVIYVARDGIEEDAADNFDIKWEDADYFVDNSGSVADMLRLAGFIARAVRDEALPPPTEGLAIQITLQQ